MARAGLVATGALFAALITGRTQAAVIVVDNVDVPGKGFNDETPTAPVGGNPGTTLGQQRLNALQYAADIWGSILASDVPILVAASFSPLSCGSTSATLYVCARCSKRHWGNPSMCAAACGAFPCATPLPSIGDCCQAGFRVQTRMAGTCARIRLAEH